MKERGSVGCEGGLADSFRSFDWDGMGVGSRQSADRVENGSRSGLSEGICARWSLTF